MTEEFCVTCKLVHEPGDCIAALTKALQEAEYLIDLYRDSAEHWRLLATTYLRDHP